MALETVYSVINVAIVPAWILLIFAPGWSWTNRIVQAAYIPLIFAAIYAYFLIWGIFFGGGAQGAGMGSLKAVMTMFDSPVSMLAGWVHYLIFDLFVGAWIVRDGLRNNIGSLLRAPCLVLTFVFGPTGLALYLLIRFGKVKTMSFSHT